MITLPLHLWQNSTLEIIFRVKRADIKNMKSLLRILLNIRYLFNSVQSVIWWHVNTRSFFFFNLICFIRARYFICRWVMRQSCSIVQKLVVNYHLVVSYPKQCHIGIKVSHWCLIIIALHIMLLFAVSRAELWIILISYSHNCHM